MSTRPEFFPDPRGRNYSDAVVVGDLVYVSGQAALDDDDQIVGVGDFEAQVRQTYGNIESALAKCGATWSDVVKTTTHFKRIVEDYPSYARVRGELLTPPYPATIGVQSELFMPELLFEMDAIAVLPK
jgi:enamine deaminase RidA (YjgF/YER057c/UK114 family)